jgi:hypothetical protein
LLDAGTVSPVVDERVLVHEPSGAAFESLWQLAVFHDGWTAAAAVASVTATTIRNHRDVLQELDFGQRRDRATAVARERAP